MSGGDEALPKLLWDLLLLAICRPSSCTVASGVVGVVVVVVGVCNRSQMRTSKCTCLIFGANIGLDDHGWKCTKCTKGIFDRSKFKVTRDISPDHLWMASSFLLVFILQAARTVGVGGTCRQS